MKAQNRASVLDLSGPFWTTARCFGGGSAAGSGRRKRGEKPRNYFFEAYSRTCQRKRTAMWPTLPGENRQEENEPNRQDFGQKNGPIPQTWCVRHRERIRKKRTIVFACLVACFKRSGEDEPRKRKWQQCTASSWQDIGLKRKTKERIALCSSRING